MPYLKQWESKCYVPVGAAQRQTIACSCNIRHFVAEGPAEMYGDQFPGIRNSGEALLEFRIPVTEVREFRITVGTTAIPDSSTRPHLYSGFQWMCYWKSGQTV